MRKAWRRGLRRRGGRWHCSTSSSSWRTASRGGCKKRRRFNYLLLSISNELWRRLTVKIVVLSSVVDPDPHHFANQSGSASASNKNPDPLADLHQSDNLDGTGSASICSWQAKMYWIWAYYSTFSRVWAFMCKLGSGFGSASWCGSTSLVLRLL
jgi:hypothetical protein